MTVRDNMAWADRRILRSRIVKDLATFGPTENVEGAFNLQPREIELPGGSIMHVGITFECRYVASIGDMVLNDPVEIQGHGTYRFLRELLPGGDESGMTTIELGERL